MTRNDLLLVLKCVDALGTLAEFNCMIGHGREAATTIAEQLENFFGLGLWYGRRVIVNAVMKACEDAGQECYTANRIEFRPGLTSLRYSVRKMRRQLAKAQPGWRHQIRRLNRFLGA
jgi:hypothetical protein